MKRYLIFLLVIIFCASGVAFAKGKGRDKGGSRGKAAIEQSEPQRAGKIKGEKAQERIREEARERHEKTKEKMERQGEEVKKEKEKVRGKKTEPPEGVQKAVEKGKGKKKGLLERWFGGSKDEPEKARE